MSKLRDKFSTEEWQKCCTGFCDDCHLAKKYKKEYGTKEGKKKLKKDKKKVLG